MANLGIQGPIPLVEGFVVSSASGVIDTRTEVANSLHPLLDLVGAFQVIVKIWDSSVGGTAKAISSINHNWRTRAGGLTGSWIENAAPAGTGGGFQVCATSALTSLRSPNCFALTPVNWNAQFFIMPGFQIDDYAMRIVTDGTTNSGTFSASAYVIRPIG